MSTVLLLCVEYATNDVIPSVNDVSTTVLDIGLYILDNLDKIRYYEKGDIIETSNVLS